MSRSKAEEGPADPRENPRRYLPLDRGRAQAFLDDWEETVRGQLRRMGAEEEDVLYRIFHRALGGLSTFRGESRLSTWLYRITYRESLRHLERSQRRGAREAPLEAAAHREASSEEDPQELLERRERAETVQGALARLDPRDREIVALRYLEDLKLAEMARRLDLPLGTVKTRLSRAMNRLKRELDRD